MEHVDAVVVGAGVIGLAVARELAARGRDTLILEGAARFGTGASERNSEVIHAGIYYAPGSLKARLCVRGREQLYAYCATHAVPHRRCGKLIVATDAAQLQVLAGIAATARANGVALESLPAHAAQALEPELSCTGALYSPLTGIVDAHAYMLALLADAESDGATLVCNTRVTQLVPDGEGIAIAVNDEAPALRAALVINCAGLGAIALARQCQGLRASYLPHQYYAKGSYFALRGPAPFAHLIYPVPEVGGLGIHLTLDLAGRARFGPDVEWVEACSYEVDERRAAQFCRAIRRYWPQLPDDALAPAYAGMRTKISGPAEAPADFRIEGPATHGVAGLVNLFGIESPGLTASLAVASEAVSRIG
jgi:L-2-hydroxyglutarate oxidase LhgO